VASDAKAARAQVSSLLAEGQTPELAAILDRATRPGEGRVRQVIATAARLDTAAGRIKEALLTWLDTEADEFTKGAIRSALDSTKPAPARIPLSYQMPERFVEAYRYLAERLCHRVRNPLTKSASLLMRLQQLSQQTTDADSRDELVTIYSELQGLFQRVGRIVEFDINDGQTQWQAVALGQWLDGAGPLFAGRHGQATLVIQGSEEARRARIRATGFLLDTVFGNLWANAVQASEQVPCRITAEMKLVNGSVEILFRDDGPGFSADQVEAAFRLAFSTKGESRGRGLLEIAEAVGRLQGAVHLVEVAAGEHRIRFRFPMDGS